MAELLAKEALFQRDDIEAVSQYLDSFLTRNQHRTHNHALAQALVDATIEVLGNRSADHPCFAYPAGETGAKRIERLVAEVTPEAKALVKARS